MFFVLLIMAASAALVSARTHHSSSAKMTPHEQYSSSVGVLGCKINTNRVAYWPRPVSCDDICVQVKYKDREVYLLRIDTSEGAYDISYDAWNYLGFGKSAMDDPQQGGGIDMEYKTVHPSNCKCLLDDGKLPLSAATSMDYVASCVAKPTSWVSQNFLLYNIYDPICKLGIDELCSLDLATSNQPTCPSGLGSQNELGLNIENIQYGTGTKVTAP
ncbi:hypothetical protein EDB81DRAFT_656241 [Dactylonectria macrodidyma]|uniref:Cerato-platanin n=1 Tax=Dactylonectria macrodidyma TaxID=307937 RepID=A0A9P9EG12_9HYPO|nr:hypothetical protein EDB81DRAFT_656241 [Dactylonectria macrodidyma]